MSARCTVARLMAGMGPRSIVRGCRVKTTIPAIVAERPLDLVERKLIATPAHQLWVADLTYVETWRGVVHVAVRH